MFDWKRLVVLLVFLGAGVATIVTIVVVFADPAVLCKLEAEPGLTLLFTAGHCSDVRAFWGVIATFLVLLTVVAWHAGEDSTRVGVYRPYEQALVRMGRLKLSDMLGYHSQFQWGNYAAVTIGMVLVTVTLIAVEEDELFATQRAIQYFAVFCMTTAAILLAYADLLHTNTQTPIVPVKTRFRMIDTSVQFGTLGAMVTLLAVLLFVAMISGVATFCACVVYVGVLLVVQHRRKIDLDEFFAYFELDEQSREQVMELVKDPKKEGAWPTYAASDDREHIVGPWGREVEPPPPPDEDQKVP